MEDVHADEDHVVSALSLLEAARTPVYVHPGTVVVSVQAASLSAILGSCVAVCLWDPRARVGGMNHFALPCHTSGGGSALFGDVALPRLVGNLLAVGASRAELLARIFGGAYLADVSHRADALVGQKNVEVARRMLAELAIPVVAEDTGGGHGRRLFFHTDQGTAWARRL